MALYDFEMAYDAADGYVVLLGGVSNGSSSYPPPTEMWTFTGGAWTQQHPTAMPQNCPGSALTYDDADGSLLYFGAANQGWWSPSCSSANQTWTYQGGAWTKQDTAASPSGRTGAEITNDTADGYVVLFGGLSSACAPTGYCNDTWEYQAGDWTELFPSTAPSSREEAGFTYSGGDGYPFLFGGVGPNGTSFNDTWTFSGGNWTQLFPASSPPWVQPDALSYDSADAEAVYTSAWNFSTGLPEETWVYHAGNWSQVSAPGPAERLGAETAYDDPDGFLVFFGGYGGSGLTNETWKFLHNTWTLLNLTAWNVSLTVTPGAADLLNSYQVNASVTGPADIYSYTYTGLPPGCASANASSLSCVPTTTGSYMVVVTVTNSSGDARSANAYLIVNAVPVAQLDANPSTAIQGSWTLLVAGVTGGTQPYTFAWAGLPPSCVSISSPVLNCTLTTPGTYVVEVFVTDHVGVWASANATLTVTPAGTAPTISSFTVRPSSVILGQSVTYSVTAAGTGPLTYVYQGLPTGCAAANVTTFTCQPTSTGNYTSRAIVSDTLGRTASANVTLLVGWIGPPPVFLVVTSFVASPPTIATGHPTVLQIAVGGGVPPYSYAYANLPPGCPSLSAASLVCVPSESGTFTVTVVVTDGAGNTASASTVLTVQAAGSTSSGTSGETAAGPTWLEFGLGVLATGFGVALVLVLALRRRGPGTSTAK